MGQYFLVVNPAKKQYLDAGRFGENIKRSGIFCGRHAQAVGLILCHTDQPRGAHPLIGSWAGDPIFVTGDYALPDSKGMQTTTPDQPERNLYELACQEYEDITPQAIMMLIAEKPGAADELVNQTKYDSSLLVELGYLVFRDNCEPLREALERNIGKDWAKKFREASRNWNFEMNQLTSGSYPYRIMVAGLLDVPDLAAEFKKAALPAHIRLYSAAEATPAESESIMLGAKIPADLAVNAIRLATIHWPFLCYLRLSNDLDNDPPEYIHSQIFFGGHSKSARADGMIPWTEEDFQALDPAMRLSQLHHYIRSHYESK
jgi:hypothetical protein